MKNLKVFKGYALGCATTGCFLSSAGWGVSALADLNAGACSNAQQSKITTQHSAVVNGKDVEYSATAGFLEVIAADQSAKACIFYTSYTVSSVGGSAVSSARPLTFAFNGGPGSASLWLHLGLLGPERVDMGQEGLTAPQNLGLIPNTYSPLDVTDIVLIDPAATGFSSAEGGKANNDKFFGVKNDYVAIGSFVENFLNTYNRWLSPKYILGESYGGVRGTLLANYLQSEREIELAGLILISPALSDTTFFGLSDNPIPYWTYFPSFATTAWYHKLASSDDQKLDVATVYANAKEFADSKLRDALELGSGADPRALSDVAERMAKFTGFDKDTLISMNLHLSDIDVFARLLAKQGLCVGRYDSRFTQPVASSDLPSSGSSDVSDSACSDPSGTIPGYAFSAAINQYLRVDLNVQLPLPYNIFGDLTSWPGPEAGSSFGDVMSVMAQALAGNPNFKVMIASGYFDLACPAGTVDYELSQLPNARALASRVTHDYYPGGHMMYLNPQALGPLTADLRGFIENNSRGGEGAALPQR